MSPRFSAGWDLAQANDFACLLIVERKGGLLRKRRYEARFAQRWRHFSYQTQIKEVAGILSSRPFRDDVRLTVDATGLGGPVMEMIDQAKGDGLLRCEVNPIVFSAGNEPNPQKNSVPKNDLIRRLEILLNDGRITFASDLLMAKIIRRELENFQAKLSETGRTRFEAAGSGHDDWVSATALAVYEIAPVMVIDRLDYHGGAPEVEHDNDYGLAPPDSWDDESAIQRKLAQGERRGLVLSNGSWQRARCHGAEVVVLGDRFWCAPGNHFWGEEQRRAALPGAPTYKDFFGD